MKYKISQKNAWFQDVSRATPQTNPKDNCFIGNLVALTRQLGWARATGKTLHLVRVYQARVLHGGQVMWCCVRVVQPQVYRACVCIYIHIIYILYICIFNIPTFLALCFSTSVFLRTFTSRCQERSWWNCILGWRHCICSCWMARAKIVGMPRGLRAGLHEEKQRDFQQTCGYDTTIL